MFYRTLTLFRQLLRREGLKLLIWLAALTFLATFDAGKNDLAVNNAAQAASLYAMLKNPTMIALFGPAHTSLSALTNGTAFAQTMTLFVSVIIAVLFIRYVVSRSRAEEDDGLTEQIGAYSVGRLSASLSLILMLCLFFFALTFSTALSLQFQRISAMQVFSSNLNYSLSLSSQGLLWSAVALLCAQLFGSASRANSVGLGLLALFYILRLSSDLSAPNLSWLNPLSWSYLSSVYAKETTLPLFLSLILAGIIFILALAIQSRRDLGEALIRGKSFGLFAKKSFRSIEGLILYQQRGLIVLWSLGLFLFGFVFGATFAQTNRFLSANPVVRKLMSMPHSPANPLAQYLAMLLAMMAILSGCFAVSSLMTLVHEEQRGRINQLYAFSLSRLRVYLFQVTLALLLGCLGLCSSSLGLYAGQLGSEATFTFSTLLKAGLIWLPAVALVVSLLALLISLAPRLASFIWVYLAFAAFDSFSGNFIHFPPLVRSLNVFNDIPKFPAEKVATSPLIALSVFSILIVFAGQFFYRQRDLG